MSEATANVDASETNEPARDRSLGFHWRAVDDGWITLLDLPAPRNRRQAEATASEIAAIPILPVEVIRLKAHEGNCSTTGTPV
jgi:hypothetical protein